jgi:hypothetical protein
LFGVPWQNRGAGMADPVIVSIEASEAEVGPGQLFTVRIVATGGGGSTTFRGVVTDDTGREAFATLGITLTGSLTYRLEDVDGAGFGITQDAGDPGLFHVVAPG